MEQLLNIVASVRSHFLNKFVASLNDFRERHSPSAPEVLIELQLKDAYPFRLYRADILSNVNGHTEIKEVNPDSYLNFEPFTVTTAAGLQILFHPIAWYGTEFKCNTDSFTSGLENWTLRWLDPHDEHELDAHGLQGVIHSVTAPTANDNNWEFTVDFGSAPIEAMEELFVMLATAGVTKVEVSSSCID